MARAVCSIASAMACSSGFTLALLPLFPWPLTGSILSFAMDSPSVVFVRPQLDQAEDVLFFETGQAGANAVDFLGKSLCVRSVVLSRLIRHLILLRSLVRERAAAAESFPRSLAVSVQSRPVAPG